MAPIAPFYADRLYCDLMLDNEGSVHLASFPVADEKAIDPALEKRMHLAQTLTSMVLALRRKVNIKVRQPLGTIMVPVADENERAELELIKDLVLSEVNVKEMKIVGSDEGILVKRVKPDFKKLGPKFGKKMKQVAAAIAAMDTPSIIAFEKAGFTELVLGDETVRVDLADVDIFSEDVEGWLVANEGTVTVALDVTVTPELRKEGIARDIVNRIQNIRKSRDYSITDRINLVFAKDEETDGAIKDFGAYIAGQVLAESISVVENLSPDSEGYEALDIDGIIVGVTVNPA